MGALLGRLEKGARLVQKASLKELEEKNSTLNESVERLERMVEYWRDIGDQKFLTIFKKRLSDKAQELSIHGRVPQEILEQE